MNEWIGLLRSLLVYWRPGRQRALRRLYAPFVRPGALVFDVGAHLGDRTSAFAGLGARVIALEPQPRVARWLRRIVGGRPGVSVIEEAVGRTAGTARLAVSSRTPTVSTLSESWRARMPQSNEGFRRVRWERDVEVPVTTLDALIRRFGLPDFCKLDIEGHEAEALAGLTAAVPALSVEFVSGGLEVADACIGRLAALGDYRFNVVAAEERRFRLDRWVTSSEMRAWIAAGADALPFGDIYARLEEAAPPAPSSRSVPESP